MGSSGSLTSWMKDFDSCVLDYSVDAPVDNLSHLAVVVQSVGSARSTHTHLGTYRAWLIGYNMYVDGQ